MKIFIILLIFIQILLAQEKKSTCGELFIEFWKSKILSDNEVKLINTCQDRLNVQLVLYDILIAEKLYLDQKYEEAIEVLQKHNNIKLDDKKYTEIDKKAKNYFLLKRLSINAFANYDLKKWEEAAQYFKVYLQEEKDTTYMMYLAKCYSEMKDYERAVTLALEVFHLEKQYQIAYEIAVLYLRQNNIKNAIKWLQIVKENEPKMLDKLNNDQRFDSLRNLKEFQQF